MSGAAARTGDLAKKRNKKIEIHNKKDMRRKNTTHMDDRKT